MAIILSPTSNFTITSSASSSDFYNGWDNNVPDWANNGSGISLVAAFSNQNTLGVIASGFKRSTSNSTLKVRLGLVWSDFTNTSYVRTSPKGFISPISLTGGCTYQCSPIRTIPTGTGSYSFSYIFTSSQGTNEYQGYYGSHSASSTWNPGQPCWLYISLGWDNDMFTFDPDELHSWNLSHCVLVPPNPPVSVTATRDSSTSGTLKTQFNGTNYFSEAVLDTNFVVGGA